MACAAIASFSCAPAPFIPAALAADKDAEIAELRSLLAQRERDLGELHHRVANSLQLATGFLLRARLRLDSGVLQQVLDETAARLVAVGLLHRFLYLHGEEREVDLKPFFEEVCHAIAASTGLQCHTAAESIRVPGHVAQSLGVVVNELALNAAKHGYGGEAAGGRISIDCRRDAEGQLRLAVRDGGKGLPDGFRVDGAHGMGMATVTAIVRQLRGRLDAANDGGASFTLTASTV